MCFVIIWFKFILKWEGGGTIYSTCSSYTYYFIVLDWVQTQFLLNVRTTTVLASKTGEDWYLFPNTKCLYFSHMLFLSVMRRSVNFLQEDLMFLFFVCYFRKNLSRQLEHLTFQPQRIFGPLSSALTPCAFVPATGMAR